MATITQNVETFDKITLVLQAGSGSTVSFSSETNCTVNPKGTQNSPGTYTVTNFSGGSYTASFTDEASGTLDVTGSVSSTGAWISDTEQFVLRAEYNSQPVDLKYTVVKSKDGSIGSDGSAGLQVTNGIVYYNVASASAPNGGVAPTADSYNFSTNSFTNLSDANWVLERPTITASNANNYWESNFLAQETTPGLGTGPVTFTTPVRVQDGFGDSVTENVSDINAASTKWVGPTVIGFNYDGTNYQPRSSSNYNYTYTATNDFEYAHGSDTGGNGEPWIQTLHEFFAGSTKVAEVRLRHIGNPGSTTSSGGLEGSKVRSVYYSFTGITGGATYTNEANYTININGTSHTESYGTGGSQNNGYDQIQNYDGASGGGYVCSITHTPSNSVTAVSVSISGINNAAPINPGDVKG